MNTYSAEQIAKYFLTRAAQDEDAISNLKLQKLCYYAAGLIAAVRDEGAPPLFHEAICAWQHGPVVPALYRIYAQHGASNIPADESYDNSAIALADRAILNDVWSYYGQYSAWKLRNMTHEERPWVEAWNESTGSGSAIETSSLRSFFLSEVEPNYVAAYQAQQRQQSPV